MAIEARYPGTCPECGEEFDKGDMIESIREREWRHRECPDDPRLPDKPVEGCTECFMVKPCMCDYEKGQ